MAQATIRGAFITFMDHEGKPTTTEYFINSADFAAYIAAPGAAGNVRTLLDATDAQSLGFKSSEGVRMQTDLFPEVLPAGDADLRQSKVVLTVQDNVNGRIGTISIGIRDPAGYNLYPRSKNIILLEADGGTEAFELLVTAVSATAKSVSGNAVTVLEAKAESFNI